MQVLNMNDYGSVVGGTDTDVTKQLRQTAALAAEFCGGTDKVGTVSTTSFTCK